MNATSARSRFPPPRRRLPSAESLPQADEPDFFCSVPAPAALSSCSPLTALSPFRASPRPSGRPPANPFLPGHVPIPDARPRSARLPPASLPALEGRISLRSHGARGRRLGRKLSRGVTHSDYAASGLPSAASSTRRPDITPLESCHSIPAPTLHLSGNGPFHRFHPIRFHIQRFPVESLCSTRVNSRKMLPPAFAALPTRGCSALAPPSRPQCSRPVRTGGISRVHCRRGGSSPSFVAFIACHGTSGN